MLSPVYFLSFLLFCTALGEVASFKATASRSYKSTLLVRKITSLNADKASRDAYLEESYQRRKDIPFKQENWPIKFFVDYLKEGKLNLDPEYQRGFVWKAPKAARLIETVLGGRFIQPVVLHRRCVKDIIDGDDRFVLDIIDGKQRLSTLLAFYFGPVESMLYKLPEVATQLRPECLEEGEEHPLKNLAYADLPRKFRDLYCSYTLHVLVIPEGTDDETVFDIYEDINSGAQDLTHQQLRKAAFMSEYIKLIYRLREHENTLAIRKSDEVDQEKESDSELIVRAFAFRDFKSSNKYKSLKIFLNAHVKHVKELLEQKKPNAVVKFINDQEAEFVQITDIMLKVFGGNVCREFDPVKRKYDSKVVNVLWDALYAAINELIPTIKSKGKSPGVVFTACADAIRSAFEGAFREGRFEQLKRNTKKFYERRELMKDLMKPILQQYIAANATGGSIGKRAFNRDNDLIQSLYDKQGGKCAICGNDMHKERVFDGSYAQLDHIHPWSEGGKTDEESNCQLTHAVCNRNRVVALPLISPPPQE